MKYKKLAKIILYSILALIAIIILGTIAWSKFNTSPPTASALEALVSDDAVTVTDGRWLVFEPKGLTPEVGLIFYPGGLVEPAAYAPVLKRIAAQGILVVITPMPLNLAIINPNAATAVIKAYPQIITWALAGHSLGGTTAAIYVDNNPGMIDILVFWAAYPPDTTDLSDSALQVISIFGSQDKLSTPAEIEATKHLLPENTTYIEIQGGNHEQFGDYGRQEGDGIPGITREEQHALIVEYMLETLTP